jgi:acyl-CoA synthetase (AMP-forming)/AMP-acid ligase II
LNLAETIAHHARARPEVPAVIEGEQTIDYRALDCLIRQGAANLRSLGIGAGDAVAICLGDTADHLIAFLSAARLGAVSVPIDWRAPPAERSRIARGLGAKLVLGETRAPSLGDVPHLSVDARGYSEAAHDAATQEFPSDADAPLMIGLTSGTTGAVKGMLVTHRQMHARTIPVDAILPPGPHRYFSASPLAFSAGRGYCLTFLILGHTVVLHPSLFDAEEYVESINRSRATASFVVPTTLRALLQLPSEPRPLLPGLKALICGGAPLHPQEKRAALHRLTPNFHEVYGTIGTGPISVLQPGDIATHADSAGRPHRAWQVEIVDESGRIARLGGTGRVRIRGPGLASGLVGTGSTSSEGFHDGWYYTGDLATIDAECYLRLQGRTNDVILRGGSSVYAEEIEAVLAEHPLVAEAAVVGRPSPQLGEEVVAFAVSRATVEPEALIDHCRKRLTAFKVPCEIILVADLPRTTFGKVDRKRLRSSLAS